MESFERYNSVLVADIGGTHLTAALCDIEKGIIIEGTRSRIEFDSNGLAKNILDSWTGILCQVSQNVPSGKLRIGIAMPGPFDYKNGISYIQGLGKYESLYGMDIRRVLSAALRVEPADIRFRNDAESTIAGEVFAGGGSNYADVIGFTLGTGFGSAHYSCSRTVDLNWGSTPYLESIADDFLSTRWLLKRYQELSGQSVGGVKKLADRANDEAFAVRVFEEFAENLRAFLALQLKGYSPEILLFCGNIAKCHRYFLPYLKEHFKSIHLEVGKLGEDAALLGASALFREEISIPYII